MNTNDVCKALKRSRPNPLDKAAYATWKLTVWNFFAAIHPVVVNMAAVQKPFYDKCGCEVEEALSGEPEAAKDFPQVTGKVMTYLDGKGHGAPLNVVSVDFGQGILVKLPPLEGTTDQPDIYIERREDRWTINVTPDNADVRVVVTIHDNAAIDVSDAHGTVVLHDDATPTT